MSLIRRLVCSSVEILFVAALVVGCSGGDSGPGSPPAAAPGGTGGSRPQGTGGSNGSGGVSGNGGTTAGSGGSPAAPGGAGGGSTVDASTGSEPDTSGGSTPDGGGAGGAPGGAPGALDAGVTPMAVDGGPQPSYEGAIPIYYGGDVGPKVEMQCPGDPTEGWTEYADAFNVQRPHNMPINSRFSITNGIYNFWVFPNDAPHSPTANGRNPRTEARYGWFADAATARNFTSGQRLYSADMLIERNAVNSAIIQIHTTADGGGPIGLRVQSNGDIVNNGSLTVVQGSSVPGGTIDKWFNFKASFDSATLEVKIYINNCLKSTYKGPRGDGNFYFKNGVYFCKTSQNGCYSHYKNIHLYKK